MSRFLQGKSGRFSVRAESDFVWRGLRDYSALASEPVLYYRFSKDNSQYNIYGEAYEGGKVYAGPINMPTTHIIHTQGGNDSGPEGFYFNDTLHVTTSYKMSSRIGLTEADLHHERYLNDRIVYRDLVFRVTLIGVLGQVQKIPLILSFECTQVKPDELRNDPQFAFYASAYESPSLQFHPVPDNNAQEDMNHTEQQFKPKIFNPYPSTAGEYGAGDYGDGPYG